MITRAASYAGMPSPVLQLIPNQQRDVNSHVGLSWSLPLYGHVPSRRHPEGILFICPNLHSRLLSMWSNMDSTVSPSWMIEPFTPSLKESPDTLEMEKKNKPQNPQKQPQTQRLPHNYHGCSLASTAYWPDLARTYDILYVMEISC